MVEALRGGHRPTGLTSATKPGSAAAGGAVGHLVEARARVERARGLVVHRRVERDRRQAARARLALGLGQQRPRGAAAAKRRVGGERVDVERVLARLRARAAAGPVEAQRAPASARRGCRAARAGGRRASGRPPRRPGRRPSPPAMRPSSSATQTTSPLATLPGSAKRASSVASARSRPPEKRSYMSGALSNSSVRHRRHVLLTRLANLHRRNPTVRRAFRPITELCPSLPSCAPRRCRWLSGTTRSVPSPRTSASSSAISTGWSGFGLIALGLLLMLPVVAVGAAALPQRLHGLGRLAVRDGPGAGQPGRRAVG